MDDLLLTRFYSADQSTLGLLTLAQEFLCFTLEDEKRLVKLEGETRIPAGRYPLGLRLSPKFSARFGHKMIEIQNIPNFFYVYFHPGLSAQHTSGCILVGDGVIRKEPNDEQGSQIISGTTIPCYRRIYPRIREGMDAGTLTHITIVDQMPNLTPNSQAGG